MHVDFSHLRPTRKPNKREIGLYQAWTKYLRNSKLCAEQVHERAASYARAGKKVPTD